MKDKYEYMILPIEEMHKLQDWGEKGWLLVQMTKEKIILCKKVEPQTRHFLISMTGLKDGESVSCCFVAEANVFPSAEKIRAWLLDNGIKPVALLFIKEISEEEKDAFIEPAEEKNDVPLSN